MSCVTHIKTQLLSGPDRVGGTQTVHASQTIRLDTKAPANTVQGVATPYFIDYDAPWLSAAE